MYFDKDIRLRQSRLFFFCKKNSTFIIIYSAIIIWGKLYRRINLVPVVEAFDVY